LYENEDSGRDHDSAHDEGHDTHEMGDSHALDFGEQEGGGHERVHNGEGSHDHGTNGLGGHEFAHGGTHSLDPDMGHDVPAPPPESTSNAALDLGVEHAGGEDGEEAEAEADVDVVDDDDISAWMEQEQEQEREPEPSEPGAGMVSSEGMAT